jgi:hypothetical protein
MKTVTARDLQKRSKNVSNLSQKERAVVTRHGKPAAVSQSDQTVAQASTEE